MGGTIRNYALPAIGQLQKYFVEMTLIRPQYFIPSGKKTLAFALHNFSKK